MSGLEFTEEAARQLERLVLTRDVVAQRSETIKQLALSHGERVLDIGCGPGFLCESMAEIVGRDGAVMGIDISSHLVASCKRRSPPKWLSYEVGDATQLAQPDASFDAVVCTQVAEYIPDVNCALSEAFRVVKGSGRVLFLATDWDAVVWHSETPDRMALVLKSWEAHCAHPHLPRSLANRLVSTGFRFDGASVWPSVFVFDQVQGPVHDVAPDGTQLPPNRDVIKAIEAWNGQGCLVVNMAPQPAGRVFNASGKTIHGIRVEMKTVQ